MKIAVFNDQSLGIVKEDRIYDLSDVIPWDKQNVQHSLEQLMAQFGELKPKMESAASKAISYPLTEVKLQAPVPKPAKLLAAPVNYYNHQAEMNATFNNAPFTTDKIGLFLKAPSSIIGPEDTVLLPYKDRRFDHEAEIAFVIGKKARNVKVSEASEYIFGYFALMDMTLRGPEERTWRKSFDTFTPIGPWIVTSDEMGNPHDVQMKLWVNDEIRQNTNTSELIWNCFTCLSKASEVMTLYPGDIITTGTPEGVSQIAKGDRVRIHIDRIGEFSVNIDLSDDDK